MLPVTLLGVLGLTVAVAAAVRSTWSPCGTSMLSTITPLGEASRGHRWGATAGWFVVGAVLGGATLGALGALGAWAFGTAGLSTSLTFGIAAALALGAAALDAGMAPPALPHHRRQVNELWFGQYRRWVYAAGFGWQIGSGLATYIMTAGVYLVLALAVLTGSPLWAMAICTLFGAARGVAVLAARGITSPDALRAFHRRFDELGPAVRWSVAGVLLAVSIVAAAASAGFWGVTAVCVGAAAIVIGAQVAQSISTVARAALTSRTSNARER